MDVADQASGGEKRDAANVLLDWISRDDLAEQLGVKVDTLRRWDARRLGPPHAKIGARVMYRREAVRAWLVSREIDPKKAGR